MSRTAPMAWICRVKLKGLQDCGGGNVLVAQGSSCGLVPGLCKPYNMVRVARGTRGGFCVKHLHCLLHSRACGWCRIGLCRRHTIGERCIEALHDSHPRLRHLPPSSTQHRMQVLDAIAHAASAARPTACSTLWVCRNCTTATRNHLEANTNDWGLIRERPLHCCCCCCCGSGLPCSPMLAYSLRVAYMQHGFVTVPREMVWLPPQPLPLQRCKGPGTKCDTQRAHCADGR